MPERRRRESRIRSAARGRPSPLPQPYRRALPVQCWRLPLGSGSLSREHPNAGAVARHFEQCETKGILPASEHAADQPFLVLRHPMAPLVLRDFEMVRSEYRLRRKDGHTRSANPVTPVALSSSLIRLAECH
jgi:hypothetical protein